MTNKDEHSTIELAAALGRTAGAVAHKLSKLGARKRRARRQPEPGPEPAAGPAGFGARTRWGSTDDDLLVDISPRNLKKQFRRLFPGRSWSAVCQRRARLTGGPPLRGSDGFLTIAAAAKEYRCSRRRLVSLVASGVLRADRAPWGKGDWCIDPMDLEQPPVRAALEAKRRPGRPRTRREGDR
jgi:hypothetical protein